MKKCRTILILIDENCRRRRQRREKMMMVIQVVHHKHCSRVSTVQQDIFQDVIKDLRGTWGGKARGTKNLRECR